MKKVMHVVGNRPQFIKLAPISRRLKECDIQERILHTGQHYDPNMSDVFFQELEIPKPYVNLQIGSGSHAEMTAKALVGIEKELIKEKPDVVIVYGDTDSTLAAALATAKLNIPIMHVEAGIRAFSRDNPEEKNRIVTDHLSDMLFCPDRVSLENLAREGCGDKAYFTGDVMYDTFLQFRDNRMDNKREEYVLMTWHRQENTSSKERMKKILEMVEKIPYKVIYPMHPRTCARLKEFGLWEVAGSLRNLEIIQPVGYLEMMQYMHNCRWILTDSGGASKESFFAGVKCLFMLEMDVWPDLSQCGWITKVNPEIITDVEEKLSLMESATNSECGEYPDYYGDGNAAKKIVQLMQKAGYIE